jgi:hypothetical protein
MKCMEIILLSSGQITHVIFMEKNGVENMEKWKLFGYMMDWIIVAYKFDCDGLSKLDVEQHFHY